MLIGPGAPEKLTGERETPHSDPLTCSPIQIFRERPLRSRRRLRRSQPVVVFSIILIICETMGKKAIPSNSMGKYGSLCANPSTDSIAYLLCGAERASSLEASI